MMIKLKNIRIFLSIVFYALLFSARSDADQHSNICSTIKNKLNMIEKGTILENFKIDYDYQENGMDDIYQHLDIDNDGIDDSVMRSCSASLDGECHLVVKQSSGKKLELNLVAERFFIIKMNSSVYVIVGSAIKLKETKNNKRRVYQLTKQEIKLICKQI